MYNKDISCDTMKQLLEVRKNSIRKIVSDKEKALKNAPEGRLRILKRKNSCQYYLRKNSKDTNGVYIPQKNRSFIKKLAQRDYDRDLLKAAYEELLIIDTYLSDIEENSIESVYEKLSDPRKRLVIPVRKTDEEFVAEWLGEEYDRMPFQKELEEHYSANGTRVRSKSEEIIANLLERYRIPYKYEYPLKLGEKKLVRPDFLCLNISARKEIVWEHFGMMDDADYANKNTQKISYYEQNGYNSMDNFIMTFESSNAPLNSNIVKNKIEQYLM